MATSAGIDDELIATAAGPYLGGTAYLCGTDGFVESAAQLLLSAGVAFERIRTERFGPSG